MLVGRFVVSPAFFVDGGLEFAPFLSADDELCG